MIMEIVKNIIDNRYTYAQYLAVPATALSCLGFYQVMGNGTSIIWALITARMIDVPVLITYSGTIRAGRSE